MNLARKYWRWLSILLLGIVLNYIINKAFDLRYGSRPGIDLGENFMAILFSFIVLEGSRWIKTREQQFFSFAKNPFNTSILIYVLIFLYIIAIIQGLGRLVNIIFFGGPFEHDEMFIITALTLCFSFAILAVDYLLEYSNQLDKVNSLLLKKQEELRKFYVGSGSKLIIEATHGTSKVLINPDEILLIYRDGTIVYIVSRDYRKLISNQSLEALEGILPSYGFCRANRQFILTPDAIKSIKSSSYGKIELQLQSADDTNLPPATFISRPSASSFRRWLSHSTST